jgi:hypothetical protein
MAIQLKIRDIRTGDAQVAEFEGVDDAEAWLRKRPRFVEVLGPPRQGAIAPGDELRLREAMRPLDAGELAAQVEQDERNDAAMRKAIDAEQERMRKEVDARREANRSADPDRLMVVSFERGKGMHNADPADDREVTAVAKTAVLAWVAERDSWVHSRGQYVINAQVAVWPGPLPTGTSEDERVQVGGQFNVLAGTPPELN